MNIFTSLVLVVFSISLVSCASTNRKDQQACLDSANFIKKYGRESKAEYKTINEETFETREFYEAEPIQVFSGIEFSNFNKANLTLKIIDKGFFDQYSAPLVNVTRQYQYEAHPLTGTFTPVGMFVWLLHPEEMNDFTFGCTQNVGSNLEPDKLRKVKTGKSEWRDIQKNHKILVSGFDKDYEFDIENKDNSKSVSIDLSRAILNTELSKISNLKITCLDCNQQVSEKPSTDKNIKTTVELNQDFRDVKALLTIENKNSQIEEVQKCHVDTDCQSGNICRSKPGGGTECRNKTPNAVVEQPKLSDQDSVQQSSIQQVKDQNDNDVVIEDAKVTCTEIGLKKGTEKFAKCVLRITK